MVGSSPNSYDRTSNPTNSYVYYYCMVYNDNGVWKKIPNVDNTTLVFSFPYVGISGKQFVIGDTTGSNIYIIKNGNIYYSNSGMNGFSCISTNPTKLGFSMGISANKTFDAITNVTGHTYDFSGSVEGGSMSNVVGNNLYTIFILK